VPPSVVLVLYAMIARQPVGQLWLAGVVPGLMMAGLFILYIAMRCRLNPALGPVMSAEERAEIGWGEKLSLLSAGLLPIGIFAVMMVPFVNGWTSLVESSAIGALAAFLAAVLKGRMSWAVFETSVKQTLGITCMFMWIILAALAFGAVFDGLGAVKAIESLFTEKLGLNPWIILILMQVSFLVMGTFLDDTAMLVIVAPLYVPLVGALGFDLVWYGVLYTITCQIAYMTPPFGYNLFLMRAMAPPEVTIHDIYRSIVPFVGVMAVALGLVIAFPEIALWLPGTVYGQLTQTQRAAGQTGPVPTSPTGERHDRHETQFPAGRRPRRPGRARRPRHRARAGDHPLALPDLCGRRAGRACHQAGHRLHQRQRQWRAGDRAVLRRPDRADGRAVPGAPARHHRRRAFG
jgi:TRAP-type mannitol/chloroaromatic compound transport system permease large subunit